jgi:hypothetical protein
VNRRFIKVDKGEQLPKIECNNNNNIWLQFEKLRTSFPNNFKRRTREDQCWAPLFSALHALAVDDASSGACLSLRLLAAFDVQCVMDPIQRAVAMPHVK